MVGASQEVKVTGAVLALAPWVTRQQILTVLPKRQGNNLYTRFLGSLESMATNRNNPGWFVPLKVSR